MPLLISGTRGGEARRRAREILDAALGMLGVQSVFERRVHLGTLRALGFTRWQTRATLAFEAAITAALGSAWGSALA